MSCFKVLMFYCWCPHVLISAYVWVWLQCYRCVCMFAMFFSFSITLPALDSDFFTHVPCPRCSFRQVCQGCSPKVFHFFTPPSLSLSTTCRCVTCGPRSGGVLLGRAGTPLSVIMDCWPSGHKVRLGLGDSRNGLDVASRVGQAVVSAVCQALEVHS